MSTKTHRFRFCIDQKRTPSLHLQNCIKTRSFLSFPQLLCSRHGCKNRSKSSKIYHKITTKKYEARCCNNQKRTPSTDLRTCIKTRSFCRSRCCFAHAMLQKSLKNVENSRWGPAMCRRSGPPRGGPFRCVSAKRRSSHRDFLGVNKFCFHAIHSAFDFRKRFFNVD